MMTESQPNVSQKKDSISIQALEIAVRPSSNAFGFNALTLPRADVSFGRLRAQDKSCISVKRACARRLRRRVCFERHFAQLFVYVGVRY